MCELNLKAQTGVLVKFTVNRLDLVPPGIPERLRGDEGTIDGFHAQAAIEQDAIELADVGRVRDGRVDTGQAIVQDAKNVIVDMLRIGLANNGFALVSLHYHKAEKHGKTKFVITADYKRGKNSLALSDKTTQALRQLAGPTTWTAHIWDNSALCYPDGNQKPATINMVGMSSDLAKLDMVTRDGKLMLEPWAEVI